MTKFCIAENRLTGKRVSFHNGRIVVEKLRKPMPDNERKLVDAARFEPEVMLEKLEAAIRGGKADGKALLAILEAKPDFEVLVSEAPAT